MSISTIIKSKRLLKTYKKTGATRRPLKQFNKIK